MCSHRDRWWQTRRQQNEDRRTQQHSSATFNIVDCLIDALLDWYWYSIDIISNLIKRLINHIMVRIICFVPCFEFAKWSEVKLSDGGGWSMKDPVSCSLPSFLLPCIISSRRTLEPPSHHITSHHITSHHQSPPKRKARHLIEIEMQLSHISLPYIPLYIYCRYLASETLDSRSKSRYIQINNP